MMNPSQAKAGTRVWIALRRGCVSACLLVATGAGSPAIADEVMGIEIEVGADQTATLIGNADSLKTAVEELCKRGRVSLLAYDAEDRPFRARYDQIPLDRLLERLFSAESYMVGMHADDDGDTRIAWLRVSGRAGEKSASPPRVAAKESLAQPTDSALDGGSVSPGGLVVLIPAGLDDADPHTRSQAVGQLVERLESDDGSYQAFLEADPADIANRLAGNPHGREVMTATQRSLSDTALRRQLSMINRELARRQQPDTYVERRSNLTESR